MKMIETFLVGGLLIGGLLVVVFAFAFTFKIGQLVNELDNFKESQNASLTKLKTAGKKPAKEIKK